MKHTTLRPVFLFLLAAAALASTTRAQVDTSPVLVEFTVQLNGDNGDSSSSSTPQSFQVEIYPEWAPIGAARFLELVDTGTFFDDMKFFRVLDDFIAQFGIAGDPSVAATWSGRTIVDDPVLHSNDRGTVSFAMRGPNTRTTQFFINLNDNPSLDSSGFAPFGKVVEGYDVVEQLYGGYGEGAPDGDGPDQFRIQSEGNAYLEANFPLLTEIVTVQRVAIDMGVSSVSTQGGEATTTSTTATTEPYGQSSSSPPPTAPTESSTTPTAESSLSAARGPWRLDVAVAILGIVCATHVF